MEYSDCHAILASETGNGKTLAMAVPIIQVDVNWQNRHNNSFLHVQAVLALKGREEELRKVSQEGRLSNEENRASGKVAVNAPYAVIVTPGRELADQVGRCDLFNDPTLFQNNHPWRHWV